MTSDRERFFRTIRHEPHPDLLYYARFTPDIEARVAEHVGVPASRLADHFKMFDPVQVGSVSGSSTSLAERPELRAYYEDVTIPEGTFVDQHGVLRVPGSLYHFTHRVSPLRNAESLDEIERFPFAEQPIPGEKELAEQVAEAREAGLVTMCWVGHMYETAWQVRGYEEFLMDMMSEPDRAHYILERITQGNIRRAEAAARAGVDYLRTGDDVANQTTLMFHPDMWRSFIKSRWARVYDAARRINPDIQIWYHSDGNITDIIPELIEMGVTILNPVQPECMDVHEIKRRYGRQLVLDGTVGTQTTMPFGDAQDVRDLVRARAAELGGDGALMLSPTHVLEPEVPVENVLAFFETCRELSERR